MILQNQICLSKKKKDADLIMLNAVLKSLVTIDRVSFNNNNNDEKKCESVAGKKKSRSWIRVDSGGTDWRSQALGLLMRACLHKHSKALLNGRLLDDRLEEVSDSSRLQHSGY